MAGVQRAADHPSQTDAQYTHLGRLKARSALISCAHTGCPMTMVSDTVLSTGVQVSAWMLSAQAVVNAAESHGRNRDFVTRGF